MAHFVYILYSPGADKYYVGETPDVATRLLFHNELSQSSYTSRYRPWEVRLVIEVADRSSARKIERYIKGRKSRAYIERLIADPKTVDQLKQKFDRY